MYTGDILVGNKLNIVMWRIGLREAYSLDMMNEDEFIYMYDKDFLYSEDINQQQYKIIQFITNLISDSDGFSQLINEEMSFVFEGKLPDDKQYFRKHWMFHLTECLDEGHIDSDDLDVLISAVDFSNPEWTENERYKIFTILDMIRINMMVKVPTSFEYFVNPSFDVLMFANKMDIDI